MIVLPSSSEVSLLVFYITYVYSAWAKFRTEKTVVILEICDKLNRASINNRKRVKIWFETM